MFKRRGFQFEETMSGTYMPADEPGVSRPMSFSIQVRADSVVGYLRDHLTTIVGILQAPGLAESAPVEGTMTIAPVAQKLIRYELSFTGDDGKPYYLRGQKNIVLGDLRRTMTELPVDIRDSGGALFATGTLRFDMRSDWKQFLSSWRLV